MKKFLAVTFALIILLGYVMTRPILPAAKAMPITVHPTPPAGWDVPEPHHVTDPVDLSRA